MAVVKLGRPLTDEEKARLRAFVHDQPWDYGDYSQSGDGLAVIQDVLEDED